MFPRKPLHKKRLAIPQNKLWTRAIIAALTIGPVQGQAMNVLWQQFSPRWALCALVECVEQHVLLASRGSSLSISSKAIDMK